MLWLGVDEAAVPPASDVPPLPEGVTAGPQVIRCGSGGCYREMGLRGPVGQSPEELAASVGAPYERCAARSLVDRRRVCSGVHLVGERVVLYLRFDRSFSL